jgi:hypothetical protein
MPSLTGTKQTNHAFVAEDEERNGRTRKGTKADRTQTMPACDRTAYRDGCAGEEGARVE